MLSVSLIIKLLINSDLENSLNSSAKNLNLEPWKKENYLP